MLNLLTVVGENTHILPHMLKHYKDKVDKVYVGVYRQSKNDGILDEIEELGIEPFFVYTDSKYNWNKVTEIYNSIKGTKPNDWWIVSDDDELQVYPYDIEDIKIDYLHIDAGHSYKDVKQDFKLYSKLLSKKGIISIHDTDKSYSKDYIVTKDIKDQDHFHEFNNGPAKFMKELLKDPKWNVFNLFNNGILKTKPSSTGLTIVQHA